MGPVSASARLATAGVILIGLGTSTLVYLAINRPAPVTTTVLVSPTAGADEVPTDDVETPSSGATSVSTAASFGEVLLDALSATEAWRVTNDAEAPAATTAASPAACNAFTHPSSASMTTDGGATWTGIELPFERVVQVRADAANAVSVIGSDGDCSAGYAQSTDGGATWTRGPVPTSIWYVEGADFTAVHIGPATSRPCPARLLQLSGQSATSAAVLCDDATVRSTTDAGRSWTQAPSANGAVAVTGDGAKWLIARRGSAGCAGLAIEQVGASAPVGCVGIGARGPAALDMTDTSTVWAATPATSAVSTDSGLTWPY